MITFFATCVSTLRFQMHMFPDSLKHLVRTFLEENCRLPLILPSFADASAFQLSARHPNRLPEKPCAVWRYTRAQDVTSCSNRYQNLRGARPYVRGDCKILSQITRTTDGFIANFQLAPPHKFYMFWMHCNNLASICTITEGILIFRS